MSIPGLKSSVITAIPRIFAKWEGDALPFMYSDSKGYVTTGTGNLIDSPAAAMAAGTWHHGGEGGPVAGADEVAAAWQTVKDAYPDVQSTNSASLTDLRLDRRSLDALMQRTIAQNWAVLRTEFKNADKLPADAQLMLLSNAWAWGAGFPRVWGLDGNGGAFVRAIEKKDYAAASQIMQRANAHEMSINPGIVPRVRGQVVMLANARRNLFRPSVLYYPRELGGLPVPWKTPIAFGAAGALVGGPAGLAVGLAAGAIVSYVAPQAASAVRSMGAAIGQSMGRAIGGRR